MFKINITGDTQLLTYLFRAVHKLSESDQPEDQLRARQLQEILDNADNWEFINK